MGKRCITYLLTVLAVPQSAAFQSRRAPLPQTLHHLPSRRASRAVCSDAEYIFAIDESHIKFGCQQRTLTMVRPEVSGSLYEFVTSDPGAIVRAAWGSGHVMPSTTTPGVYLIASASAERNGFALFGHWKRPCHPCQSFVGLLMRKGAMSAE